MKHLLVADLRAEVERLNDPEARLELGEDARRARLAALADEHLLDLIDTVQRLDRVLYPPLQSQERKA